MSTPTSGAGKEPAGEHEILFQDWFKSVGPRTYAGQLKKAGNGNHYLVLTEGKRDEKTGEIRKCRLFIYSEDFAAFFKMLHQTAVFIREHPVPAEVKARQERFWAKRDGSPGKSATTERPGPHRDARGPATKGEPRPPANRQPRTAPRRPAQKLAPAQHGATASVGR